MGSYTHVIKGPPVKFTGALAKIDFDKEKPITLEGMLTAVGKRVEPLMRKETAPYDFEKTLTNSITWRTSKNSGKVDNPAYMIDAPTPTNAVDIGSHAPHAWYREYGAAVHEKKEGAAEFIASMKKWVQEKVGINPEGSDEERGIFWAIVKKIAKGPEAHSHTQGKMPFVAPIEPQIPAIASEVAQSRLIQQWAAWEKRYKP